MAGFYWPRGSWLCQVLLMSFLGNWPCSLQIRCRNKCHICSRSIHSNVISNGILSMNNCMVFRNTQCFLLSWLVICLRICILQIAWCYWCFPTFIYYNWPSNFWQFSQLSSIYKWNLLLFWRGFSLLQMIWLSSPLTTIYWTCPWGFLRKPSGFSK